MDAVRLASKVVFTPKLPTAVVYSLNSRLTKHTSQSQCATWKLSSETAAEELDDDNFIVFDLENLILTGATGKRVKSNISPSASRSAVSQPKRSSRLLRTEPSSSSQSTAPKSRCAACGQTGVQQRKVTR